MDFAVLHDDSAIEDWIPVVRSDVLIRHYANEAVAWSPAARTPVYLDPVAALALAVVDGEASVGEIIEDVNEIVGVPLSIARNQVLRVVTLFDRASLLTTSPARDEPLAEVEIFSQPPNP